MRAENTDSGNIDIINVSVDRPALAKIFAHKLDHIQRLASTFFPEDEIKLKRVIIFLGNDRESQEKRKNNKTEINHKKAGELHPRKSSHVNQTVDQADTSTDQSDENKAKNKLVVSNRTDKRSNPVNRTRDPRTDIGHHGANAIGSRRSQTSLLTSKVHKPLQQCNRNECKEEADKVANGFSR